VLNKKTTSENKDEPVVLAEKVPEQKTELKKEHNQEPKKEVEVKQSKTAEVPEDVLRKLLQEDTK
jgi:hypothetical protein